MRSFAAFAVICILVASSCASPINDNLFSAHVRATQSEDNGEKVQIVKRGSYPQNTDAQLKHFPLQSLIGSLEQSMFDTAMSVGSLAFDEDVILPNVTPTQVEHTLTKRHTESVTEALAERTTETLPESREIILQTTERIPANNNEPAHIIIDRISVQAHHGGVPLIPQFEVKHTKHISATIKDNGSGNTTEINIIKTASTSTSSIAPISMEQQNYNVEVSAKTVASSTASTSTSTEMIPSTSTEKAKSSTEQITTSSTTAKTTKVKLEEAEKELKEKVAEIEADPVILSARI